METIRNVSELLEAACGQAISEFAAFDDVTHPRVVGDMYEGVTGDVLATMLLPDRDLRLVNGFIRMPSGGLSTEFDRMIVIGNGTKIPKTETYIYEALQVVAIVSVKKTLNSKLLEDELLKLAKVKDVLTLDTKVSSGFSNAYRAITRRDVPGSNELSRLPIADQFFYHCLKLEAGLPLRILISYYGYETEKGLREAIIDQIEAHNSVLGPVSLSNLIICGRFSVIKSNGLPFIGPIDSSGYWHFYATSSERPFYFLLELLLTRISFIYGISMRGMDDLIVDGLNVLISGAPQSQGGWYYLTREPKEKVLRQRSDSEWEPRRVTEEQVQLLFWINEHDSIKQDDWVILEKRMGISSEALKKLVLDTELVYQDVNGDIRMTFDNVTVGIFGDEYFAVENATDRLAKWVEQNGVTRTHITSDGTVIISLPSESNEDKNLTQLNHLISFCLTSK